MGARNCTSYGEKYAYEFAEKLAEYGVQIVSGLAAGIDGISQRGALMGQGKTFAVLGNGVDICYPREHIGLYSDIIEQGGGIISELPPGTKPLPFHFPRRNRIISGLSDLILVMEAREIQKHQFLDLQQKQLLLLLYFQFCLLWGLFHQMQF